MYEKIKVVLWGVGIIGKRLVKILPKGSIVAIIDNNSKHQGLFYQQIPVISYETYKKENYSEPIVVTPLKCQSIVECLRSDGVENFWLSSEEPLDMYSKDSRSLYKIFNELFFQTDNVAIIGGTLFSLFLYEYLKERECEVEYFLYEEHMDSFLYENIKGRKFIGLLKPKNFEKVLVCNRRFLKEDLLKYSEQSRFVDATDSFLYMENQEYKRLASLKDIYKGKRCFVVANGPSLLTKDLDTLYKNRELSFGVNLIHKTSNEVKWRPNVYVASETNFVNIDFENFLKYDTDYKLITDGADQFWDHLLDESVFKYNCRPDYGSDGMVVSGDICKCVYVSMTVIHACLQIAMYMGIKEIYLIGADTTSYQDAKDKHSKSHFSEKYDEGHVSKLPYVPFLDIQRVINGYVSIKKYADANGVKIYNATRGGELEVFERVDFDSLLMEESLV